MADIFTEAEGLRRRRALLEQLSQQNAQAPIQGKYGLAQALMKVVGGLAAQRQGGQLDAALEANRGQYNQQLSGEVSKYLDRSGGRPGETMTTGMADALMNRDQAPPPLAEPVKPDPRRAVAEAMASRFPEMQGVGKAGLSELLADIKASKKSPGFKEHVVDGSLVRTYDDGRVENLGNYKQQDVWEAAPDMIVDGKTVKVQRNKTTGEVKAIGSGQNISVSNTPENKGQQALYETTIKQISPKGDSYEAARAARSNLRTTTEALGAMKSGADMGALADFGLQLRKLGERVGIPNAATTPTDQLSSLLKGRVFDKLGGLGVAISDSDRKFMQEAAGDISKDPQAMKRLMALDAAASILEIQQHNARIESLPEGFELAKTNRIPVHFSPGDDPEFDQMLQNALAGRPTTNATSRTPMPTPSGGGPKAPLKNGYGDPVQIKGF